MSAVVREGLRVGWRSVGRDVLGLVYPRLCIGCDLPLRTRTSALDMCEDCEQGLKRISEPFCSICCQPFDGAMKQGFACVNCGDRHLEFDFAVCAYRSRGLAREMIHRFKYERQHHLVRALRECALRALGDPRIDGDQDWVVVPVPLHPRRRREREFNQSAEIARGLVDHHGWPLVSALQRIRYTRRQARLDRRDRLKNLRKAFAPARAERSCAAIHGRPVLLVDDVLTTGATASTCAGILRSMGAAKVVVVTPVRG